MQNLIVKEKDDYIRNEAEDSFMVVVYSNYLLCFTRGSINFNVPPGSISATFSVQRYVYYAF